jgi:hypothetical protein
MIDPNRVVDQMQQISSKTVGEAAIDCTLAEQYAEILRLRARVRRAELAAKTRTPSRSVQRNPSRDIAWDR